MLARVDDPEHLAIAHEGRDGHDAAAERLAQQIQIGDDVLPVAGEGAADAPQP